MKIILIGFACSYKSTVGALLSEKPGLKHIDVDKEAERTAKRSISEIFETSGEAEFRRTESVVLSSLQDVNDVVISCGGGSVLSDGFASFASKATVVWLTVTADSVLCRLGDTPRPLFDGLNANEIEAIIAERSAYYSRYADVIVSTDGKTSIQVAEEIYNKLFE
ncbi:MAG: shikimate kinase [Firmicutes bacterium]|nr:shikimate kinase [Bacillota bacterium]